MFQNETTVLVRSTTFPDRKPHVDGVVSLASVMYCAVIPLAGRQPPYWAWFVKGYTEHST